MLYTFIQRRIEFGKRGETFRNSVKRERGTAEKGTDIVMGFIE